MTVRQVTFSCGIGLFVGVEMDVRVTKQSVYTLLIWSASDWNQIKVRGTDSEIALRGRDVRSQYYSKCLREKYSRKESVSNLPSPLMASFSVVSTPRYGVGFNDCGCSHDRSYKGEERGRYRRSMVTER